MAETTLDSDELVALRNEIRMAEKLNEQELEPQLLEAVERYAGRHVPTMAEAWTIVLNEIYPVIQYNLPAIFFRNPRVFLKPKSKFYIAKRRNPLRGSMEEVQLDSRKSAKTQEHITNHELLEIGYKNQVRKVLLDALLFPYGLLWHGYKGDFGMTEERSLVIQSERIFVTRVRPDYFIKDPSATIENLDEARWVGRKIWMPLIDLLEDDRLHVDKEKLKGTLGYTQKVPDGEESTRHGADTIIIGPRMMPLHSYADKEFKDSPFSRFVCLYEIFRRPSKKEKREGKRGKVILLSFEQQRPHRVNSWDYFAEGWPGKPLQFNAVPDAQFGLADIDIYKGEADHKNLVVNQQIRNAEQLNKVWVAISKQGTDESDIKKVQAGKNTVLVFDDDKDVRSRMSVVTAAASSNELYLLADRINTSLQEKSGVNDIRRGVLKSGEESKFSVQQRIAGSSARPAYRQDMMADFLRESVRYLLQLIKQYKSVKDAVRIIGSLDLEWSDEPTKEEVQAEVDVEIDVNSMLPENPEKEIQELMTILNLMIEAIRTPEILVKLQQEGKMFNLAPIIENLLLRLKVRDPEVFRNIRPEESEGYVSVREVRDAKDNVAAALHGQPLPSPPEAGQDHVARLEIYTVISNLLKEAGQISDQLEELIQIQAALLAEEEEKENPREGQPVNLKQPSLVAASNGVG